MVIIKFICIFIIYLLIAGCSAYKHHVIVKENIKNEQHLDVDVNQGSGVSKRHNSVYNFANGLIWTKGAEIIHKGLNK